MPVFKRKHKVGRSTQANLGRALADHFLDGETAKYYAWASGGDDGVVIQTNQRLLLVDMEPQPRIALAAPLDHLAGVHLDVEDLKPVLHVEMRSGARLDVPVASPKALDKLVDHAWRAAEARMGSLNGERATSSTDVVATAERRARSVADDHMEAAEADIDLLLAMEPDPLHIVISREHVESGFIDETLGQLEQLIATPDRIKYFRERVMVSVHGYDDDPRELSEVAEVCSFLDKLDDKFPFWLYFLDKRTSSLLMVMRCLLAMRVETDADPSVQRQHLGNLVSTWWFPALNMVAEQADLTEAEIQDLSDRASLYFQKGPRVFLDA
ncbi:hypothetical protein DFJ68_2893 [Terracoccus luteus]|uniref:Uncharacterized protein n=1 Tax=Terracoccus luteus TaxID=53356 RepID=A0A495Y330_9MICO|nr:hypothetical protein [Terracoccus luteus]RKT79423.1 hypothetical protein DFJ68_2893 [Terracoccus luteus]